MNKWLTTNRNPVKQRRSFGTRACGTLFLMTALMFFAAPLFAGNAYLSKPRVLVNGDWNTYSAGKFKASAVQKTVFDITISYHDTVPVGDPRRAQIEDVIRFFSDGLYEQSNGQHMLGKVGIFQGGVFKDKVDIVWNYRGREDDHEISASLSGYRMPGKSINFKDEVFNEKANRWESFFQSIEWQARGGYAFAHEVGHYIYGLYDEYVGEKEDSFFDPVSPTTPRKSDVPPTGPSIMNNQWNAVSDDSDSWKWLNHSTEDQYIEATETAQKRVYKKSCWEILLQDPSDDPWLVWDWLETVRIRTKRTQYIFYNPPTAADGWYKQEITPGVPYEPAREHLKFFWFDEASVFQVVIDSSWSMEEEIRASQSVPTRLDAAKAAARNFVDSLLDGSAVGIVNFNGRATQVYPITRIDDIGIRNAAKQAVSDITYGNSTAVYDAALRALESLTSYQSGAVGAVFLLSDGEDNSSSTSPDRVVREYEDASVPLITIKYGPASEGDAILADLADRTGGQFFRSPTTLPDLQEVFFAALGSFSDMANLAAIERNLNPGASEEATFFIDETLGKVVFFVNWQGASSGLDIVLRTPSGRDVAGVGAVHEEGSFVSYTAAIQVPETGEWRVELRNRGEEPLSVSAAATGQPSAGTGFSLVTGLLNGGSTVAPPDPIIFIAQANRDGVPLRGVTMEATLTTPDGVTVPLTLRDDGTSGDYLADDGVFTVVMRGYRKGSYKFNVIASNPSGSAVETYRGYLPPSDGNPVPANFIRTMSFQVEAAGSYTPPVPTPTPTPTPAPEKTSAGCVTGNGILLPTFLLLFIPILFMAKR